MASLGQTVRSNWSVLFAGAVALFLVFNGLDVGKLVPNVSWGDSSPAQQGVAPAEGTTTTTEAAVSAGEFGFAVKAFRIAEADDGGYEARITLDVINEGEDIARFQPSQVRLARNTGVGVGPSNEKLFTMDVSPHVSQLVPLTFDVRATPGSTYKISYAGSTIFSGFPT